MLQSPWEVELGLQVEVVVLLELLLVPRMEQLDIIVNDISWGCTSVLKL